MICSDEPEFINKHKSITSQVGTLIKTDKEKLSMNRLTNVTEPGTEQSRNLDVFARHALRKHMTRKRQTYFLVSKPRAHI